MGDVLIEIPHLKKDYIMTEHDIIKAESNLNVAVAHVVLVSLQSEVSVFRVNETNQGLTVPPALSIKTQSDAPSATHMQV